MNPDEDFCRWCGAEILGSAIRIGDRVFDRQQCVKEYRAKYPTESGDA